LLNNGGIWLAFVARVLFLNSTLSIASTAPDTRKRLQMRSFKEKGFGERREAAAKAKEAALQKFTARQAEDDPAAIARKAARLEAAKARETRAAERKAKEAEEKAQRAAEKAAKLAEAGQEAEKAVERQAALAGEQKAARDARYAARKAKKK
jgi:hypothetical protein